MTNNIEIIEIIEGDTKILIPAETLINSSPSKLKIFFNPKAIINRDFSILAYSAFAKKFKGPKIFLDALSGVGARSLRVANEIKNMQVIANDLNYQAVKLGSRSAAINDLDCYSTSNEEACNFLSAHSKKCKRGMIVDIDPFGSPSQYIDCGIRATMNGGLLSVTATDLQVLHGIFKKTCRRKYYGIPIKTKYSNEIAIRLILGCIYLVASRLSVTIDPIFVENNLHYYRVYVKITKRPDNNNKIGYVLHCKKCGNREMGTQIQKCSNCSNNIEIAGPLWVSKLFDKEFINCMLNEIYTHLNKKCYDVLNKCVLESQMTGVYFTSEEIASMLHMSPLKLTDIITKLQKINFMASPTSFNNCGFRTNAKITDIIEIFQSYK